MTSNHRLPSRIRPTAAVAALLAFTLASPSWPTDSFSMRTVEGTVISILHQRGEGELEMTLAQLRVDSAPEPVELLLAPRKVCDELGFEIESGDTIRARVFIQAEGPSQVQKIQNLSRGTMVRLRTLHRTPLWTSAGSWQGGPMRTDIGRHRHGQDRGGRPPR